ncbi:MAG TPA: hypothetical protein VJB70_02170 [Candidatus Paceibacterota bacterium]
MDFLKKLFGKKDGNEEPAQQMNQADGDNTSVSPTGSPEKSGEHQQGHPNSTSGKNVCEFC